MSDAERAKQTRKPAAELTKVINEAERAGLSVDLKMQVSSREQFFDGGVTRQFYPQLTIRRKTYL